MSHDRILTDEMPLTHEFLAIMLGVRRAGVTGILGSLKTDGLISASRGTVTILDRRRLEAASCECYRVVTNEYERLFAPFPITNGAMQ